MTLEWKAHITGVLQREGQIKTANWLELGKNQA
jgi:hypothetical protein